MRSQDLEQLVHDLTPDPTEIGQVRGIADDGRPVVRVGARGQDMLLGTHGSVHAALDYVVVWDDATEQFVFCESPYGAAADMSPPTHEGGTPFSVGDWDYDGGPDAGGGNYILDAITRHPDVIANLAAAHERQHRLAG